MITLALVYAKVIIASQSGMEFQCFGRVDREIKTDNKGPLASVSFVRIHNDIRDLIYVRAPNKGKSKKVTTCNIMTLILKTK
jgi:hypothetical protein